MTPSHDEITMTELPYVTVPSVEDKTLRGEITLTTAWKAPRDGVLIVGKDTPDEEWVRVTDCVGNGPYQVTVTRLAVRQRWFAKTRYYLSKLVFAWKYRVWWPVVDAAEDSARWLGEAWRRHL